MVKLTPFAAIRTEKQGCLPSKVLTSLFFAPSLPCDFGVETLDRITRKLFGVCREISCNCPFKKSRYLPGLFVFRHLIFRNRQNQNQPAPNSYYHALKASVFPLTGPGNEKQDLAGRKGLRVPNPKEQSSSSYQRGEKAKSLHGQHGV